MDKNILSNIISSISKNTTLLMLGICHQPYVTKRTQTSSQQLTLTQTHCTIFTHWVLLQTSQHSKGTGENDISRSTQQGLQAGFGGKIKLLDYTNFWSYHYLQKILHYSHLCDYQKKLYPPVSTFPCDPLIWS